MTTKIHADTGIEFPDGSVQSSAAYSKAESDGPAFSAYGNSAQTPNIGVETKVAINVEEFDSANCFDVNNNRFTPNVAGYYQIEAAVALGGTSPIGSVAIYKNGAVERRGASIQGTGYGASGTVACLIYLNGTTDYVEFWVVTSISAPLSTGPTTNYFQGFLARRA